MLQPEAAYFDTRVLPRRQSPDYVSRKAPRRAATVDWARPGRQSARGVPVTIAPHTDDAAPKYKKHTYDSLYWSSISACNLEIKVIPISFVSSPLNVSLTQ